jgi:hypothetical protein
VEFTFFVEHDALTKSATYINTDFKHFFPLYIFVHPPKARPPQIESRGPNRLLRQPVMAGDRVEMYLLLDIE